MQRIQKNQKFTVDIIDTNNLGFGVCKIDNFAVFVKNGVEGDRCNIKIIKLLRNYALAVCEELVKPSPYRITPVCPYKRCGGCVFQHVSFEYENLLKKRYIESSLKKSGITEVTVSDTLYADNKDTAYRNKAQYPLSLDKDGNIKAGFYAQHTHDVIPCDSCAIAPSVFSDIVKTLTDFFTKEHFSVYNEETRKGLLRHIYLRIAEMTGEIMVCIVINGDEIPHKNELVSLITSQFPNVRTVCLNVNKKETNVVLSDKNIVIYGDGYIEDVLCGKHFRISPLSFYQVNRSCAELLYNTAKKLLGKDYKKVLDLYCGVGTVGICVASDSEKLIGVEIVPEAIEDAKKNALLNSLDNCEFYCADASDIAKLAPKCDSIIVDPPRKGITKAVIEFIADASPKNVVYISCDPDTLIRDIAIFGEYGYKTDRITPVNMFPRTSHVESVVCLTQSCKST